MTNTLEVATTAWSWQNLGRASALCEQAERAEAMGFHSFWLPENHFGERGAVPSPLTLLAAVAARTKTLKLGCTSYLLPIRNPLLAAEEVAVLDQLSEGRLILGVGRGIQPAMFQAFDVNVSDKRQLFARNLEIMRSAWRGDPVAEDDKGEPIILAPLPVQRPEPAIWVAAFGPLALKQVAGLGLPYLASPIETLESLENNYERYHAMVAEAGQPAVTTVPVMRSVFVTEDDSLANLVRDGLARTVPPRLAERDIEISDWAIVGGKDYVRDRISEYRERLGLTLLIVRAGIPGVSEAQQLQSHERLRALIEST
jgi:alkanesulfonate monooxygenase SsuD/methylene tetrahydromethanopterin reductase-like flavin-dependent oxidoreductase (luciferase family)